MVLIFDDFIGRENSKEELNDKSEILSWSYQETEERQEIGSMKEAKSKYDVTVVTCDNCVI